MPPYVLSNLGGKCCFFMCLLGLVELQVLEELFGLFLGCNHSEKYISQDNQVPAHNYNLNKSLMKYLA